MAGREVGMERAKKTMATVTADSSHQRCLREGEQMYGAVDREDMEPRFCFALKKEEITGCFHADGKDPPRGSDHRSPILGRQEPYTSPAGL